MSITIPPDLARVDGLSVTPEMPAAEAARLLAARRVGAVPVQDRQGRVVGLVTEHDIVRVVATRAQGLRGLAVEEVMSRDLVAVHPDTDAEDALDLMRHRALRHLPVCCPEGRLLGLVGLGDLIPRAASTG
jgi:CBS domain-containing protein